MPIETHSTLSVKWATWLLIFLVVVILISTTLAIFFEIALYWLFICSKELRNRLVATLNQPIVIGGLVLLGVILLSSTWSPAQWPQLIDKMMSWRKLLLVPIAISLMQTSELKDRFLLVFIFAMGVFAIISWSIVYLNGPEALEEANSLLRNHISQGIAFFMAAFSTIFLLIQKKHWSRPLKIALVVVLVLLLTNCLIVSTSRSGYVVGLVLAVCFGFYAGKKYAIFLSPVLLLAFLAISPTANKQIQAILDDTNTTEYLTSGGARLVFLKNALPVALSAPLYGYGLNGFSMEYAKQVEGVNGWRGTVTHDPHNQYLLILTEQGVIGLLVFFAFLVSCFMQKTDRPYQFLAWSVLAGWLATSLFNGHFSSSVEGRLIFLWCGVLLAMPLSNKRPLLNA